MDEGEHSITWRGKDISYSIRRHEKCKYPGVSVLAGGKVEVLAPSDFIHAAADALVADEAPWIVQRLEGVVCWYAAAPYEFVTRGRASPISDARIGSWCCRESRGG